MTIGAVELVRGQRARLLDERERFFFAVAHGSEHHIERDASTMQTRRAMHHDPAHGFCARADFTRELCEREERSFSLKPLTEEQQRALESRAETRSSEMLAQRTRPKSLGTNLGQDPERTPKL